MSKRAQQEQQYYGCCPAGQSQIGYVEALLINRGIVVHVHAMLQEHAKSLREQHSSWRSKAATLQSENAWTGLGSDLPAQVEGLRNVQSISLGGVHALALVDDE